MDEYKHIQLNEMNIVEGISYLSGILPNIPGLIYIPKDAPNYSDISFGWQYKNGEFIPPLPPTQAVLAEYDLAQIDSELKDIFEQEKFNEWLGVVQIQTFGISRKDELIERRNELINILNKLS